MRAGLVCVLGAWIALASSVLAPASARGEGPESAARAKTERPAKGKAAERAKPGAKPAASRTAAEAAAEREALKREIASFGLIALLTSAPVEPATVFAPPAQLASRGDGAMWRASIDDSFDPASVRVSGTGDEDGGRVLGVALDHVETVGGGNGIDDVNAFDGRRGHVSGIHVVRGPRMGPEYERIPPDLIRRIVRESFDRFDLCYDGALAKDPALRGRVVVKFTIDASGEVSSAINEGSSLPNEGVVECVVRGFATLAFPESRAGRVTVVYPLDLRPMTKPKKSP